MHLQHEELALAGQAAGQGHDIGDLLLRQDRGPGGDASHQRNGDRLPVLDAGDAGGVKRGDVSAAGGGRAAARCAVGADDLHRPRPIRVSAHQAQALELVQLVLDGGGAGQAHLLADLTQ